MRELISKKDFNLIIRKIDSVWTRSERYKEIKNSYRVIDGTPNKDGSKRKSPLYWIRCRECGKDFRAAMIEIDHIDPVVPIYTTTWNMNLEVYIERRLCCPEENLRPVCKPCHSMKTRLENAERRKNTAMARTGNQSPSK